MAVRRLAEIQPDSFAFSADNLAWAKREMAKYPPGRQASAVIALLWRAQEQAGGWLPEPAIRHVADLLGLPYIRALEVATFYTMFHLEPVGPLPQEVRFVFAPPSWWIEEQAEALAAEFGEDAPDVARAALFCAYRSTARLFKPTGSKRL